MDLLYSKMKVMFDLVARKNVTRDDVLNGNADAHR